MEIIDIIILCCFIPAVFIGLKNGLVKQIVSVLVIYFGIQLSIRFSDTVSTFILQRVDISPTAVKIISFILIFFVVAIMLNLLGKLVEKIIKISTLGWLDRMLGILMAIFMTTLLMGVSLFLFNSVNDLAAFIPKEKLDNSIFFNPLIDFAKTLFPYLKSLL